MKLLKLYITGTILLAFFAGFSQQWSLKLSSNVELRSWILTNKADKKEKILEGAKVTLLKDQTVLASTMTDLNGDFVIDVPAGGDFILTVSYEGCNTKRFMVSTNGVPENVAKDNYKPTISIGGFVLSKPISGVDYIGLNEPLVKVEYKSGGQNFDKNDDVTRKGLNIISNITEAENTVINKFCNTNKMGDDALNKKNCELAKEYYGKAIKMLPDEKYPKERIKLAESCIESQNMKKEDAAAQKAAAEKASLEKAEKARIAKENATFKKENKAAKQTTVVASTSKTVNSTPVNKEKPEAVTQGQIGGGKSKYKVPGKMPADQYKELMASGANYFKTKRYKEAKDTYLEALKIKEKDPVATSKIAECDKFLNASSVK